MITCKEFMAVFGDYWEGEVAADVRRQMEGHLSHCRTCHVVLDSTGTTVKIVTESGSFDLPDEATKPIVAQIMARIRQHLES
ncbi:MAG: hypothetical protein QOJ42_6507 [Acidobacteriaceae bacterium]|nr:hypothetical protein [Acidobacteriaceae bacterium]